MPLKSISVPISEFRIQTQEELDLVCSTIRLELKRFSREHRLAQGMLVTYAPLTISGDKVKAEMCVGKREVEDLKRRMADLTLHQMLPVDYTNHLVILQDCVHTQLGRERVQEENTKGYFLGALCIDRAVMRKKGTTEVEGDIVLSFPIRHDVL